MQLFLTRISVFCASAGSRKWKTGYKPAYTRYSEEQRRASALVSATRRLELLSFPPQHEAILIFFCYPYDDAIVYQHEHKPVLPFEATSGMQ